MESALPEPAMTEFGKAASLAPPRDLHGGFGRIELLGGREIGKFQGIGAGCGPEPRHLPRNASRQGEHGAQGIGESGERRNSQGGTGLSGTPHMESFAPGCQGVAVRAGKRGVVPVHHQIDESLPMRPHNQRKAVGAHPGDHRPVDQDVVGADHLDQGQGGALGFPGGQQGVAWGEFVLRLWRLPRAGGGCGCGCRKARRLGCGTGGLGQGLGCPGGRERVVDLPSVGVGVVLQGQLRAHAGAGGSPYGEFGG